MEFYVHDINTDVLEVTVFDKDLLSPNGGSCDSHVTHRYLCDYMHSIIQFLSLAHSFVSYPSQ